MNIVKGKNKFIESCKYKIMLRAYAQSMDFPRLSMQEFGDNTFKIRNFFK